MDPNDFIQYAQKFHAITGGTVWVTEIACQVRFITHFMFIVGSSQLTVRMIRNSFVAATYVRLVVYPELW